MASTGSTQLLSAPETHKAVRFHPADLSIQVEAIKAPTIEHPDDAIVKVILAGLCGSDLHAYRGHEPISDVIVTGHEFVGEVVELGSGFSPNATSRPPLYATLKVGDKVVAPFSSSCAECHFCRIGYTSRCAAQLLFGSVALPGAQAQYVRVPKAGGLLFVIASKESTARTSVSTATLSRIADPSLLLLADVLPTGIFGALQALQHPNVLPIVRGERYPTASASALGVTVPRDPQWPGMKDEDRCLYISVIGLGPVGSCAIIALLDFLGTLKTRYKLFAIDINEARRKKIISVYERLRSCIEHDAENEFNVCLPDEALALVKVKSLEGAGCNIALEAVGNNSALSLAYTLLRPFGVLSSVGVHQAPPVPLTGRQLYDKNIAAVFGRCPVRAIFPMAVDLLCRRQDVFNEPDLAGVEHIVGLDEAPGAYKKFSSGEWGKVAFDPWK